MWQVLRVYNARLSYSKTTIQLIDSPILRRYNIRNEIINTS